MTPEHEPKKVTCEPPPPLFSRERLFTGLLALAMSVAAIVFAYQLGLHYLLPHGFQDGIDRPVLAIELPKSAADIRRAVGIESPDSPGDAATKCKAARDKSK